MEQYPLSDQSAVPDHERWSMISQEHDKTHIAISPPLSPEDINTPSSVHPPRNVLLFGSSGCGKSSIIDMLSNGGVVNASSAATPSMFEVQKHDILLDEKLYKFHDITGLNNGELNKGDLVAHECVKKLSDLVHTDLQDGISLLVFCIPQKNYRIFYDVLCQQKNSIAVIVTGLEDGEPNMESWWTKNQEFFARYKMGFQGHACVTTTKGRKTNTGYKKQEEYDTSKTAIEILIKSQAFGVGIQIPIDSNSWLDMIRKILDTVEDVVLSVPILMELYKGITSGLHLDTSKYALNCASPIAALKTTSNPISPKSFSKVHDLTTTTVNGYGIEDEQLSSNSPDSNKVTSSSLFHRVNSIAQSKYGWLHHRKPRSQVEPKVETTPIDEHNQQAAGKILGSDEQRNSPTSLAPLSTKPIQTTTDENQGNIDKSSTLLGAGNAKDTA
ncbi:hypothetical protein J3R30DRAFT_3678558 [Lentinula aciculospora]|uniref:G domain-containing protein n=1 Tax=Lentinula aciculospora TaxID=153920 RepID=A0A9W9DXR0_9AGAR|nr:hypothetical protein J3R30DRAFT_3678558 [Lentinula aciculospora]